MERIRLVIHGGAGPDIPFIREHIHGYEEGLREALHAGKHVLFSGGSALDAVEACLVAMEDNDLFNCGRGSALNCAGHVQMSCSLMDGTSMRTGAGCLLSTVKNPVRFARKVMEQSKHVCYGGEGAREIAEAMGIETRPAGYFVTSHQRRFFEEEKAKDAARKSNPAMHGTAGAVAIDMHGNIAAGTTTGGTLYNPVGRIGDTALIGCGTYADSGICGVSCTGDGEAVIGKVLAHAVYSYMHFTGAGPQEACDRLVKKKTNLSEPDLGVICVGANGETGIAFNSERMHRAWLDASGKSSVMIYR
jgi:L-asparaginase / beta-aspartyl-peptidase